MNSFGIFLDSIKMADESLRLTSSHCFFPFALNSLKCLVCRFYFSTIPFVSLCFLTVIVETRK